MLFCSLCNEKKSESEFSSKEKKKMNKRVCTECVKKSNKQKQKDNRSDVLSYIYKKQTKRAENKQIEITKEEIERRKKERKKLTNEYNKRILNRDNYLCYYCNDVAVTADHKTPISKGGFTTDENLVACCKFCNNIKDNMEAEEFIALKKKFTDEEWNILKEKYEKK